MKLLLQKVKQIYHKNQKMADRQDSTRERKRERQPISVPFIWEERPGAPKKDWKPVVPRIMPAPLPVKLVVSVPFGWEEKPGTPLRSYVQPRTRPEPVSASSQEQSPIFSPSATCLDKKYGKWRSGNCSSINISENEGDGQSDTYIDASSDQTDDSFISAQSLLTNGLISTNSLSGAVPVQKNSLALTTTNSGPLQSTDSPDSEAESTASSYATGATGLVGASFLEWLFPLIVQNSSLRERVGCQQKELPHESDVQINEFLHEGSCSQIRKPLLTLNELIVMSRRISCRRKIKKMHEEPSTDFMRRNALSCIFGIGNGISGLPRKWKRQLQLKLL